MNEVTDEVINEGSKKQEVVCIFCSEELNLPYLCATYNEILKRCGVPFIFEENDLEEHLPHNVCTTAEDIKKKRDGLKKQAEKNASPFQ